MVDWAIFVLCVLLTLLFLYIPSFPLLKCLHFNNVSSFALSPAVSIAVYGTVSIIFAAIGVFTNFYVLLLAYVLLCLIFFVVFGIRRGLDVSVFRDRNGLRLIGLYIFVGVLVTTFVFIMPMGDPLGMGQNYDDMHHYSVMRNFLDSGNYSILNTSIYGDLNGKTSFYPAGLHLIVASVASAGNFSILIAYNAVLFVSVSIIWTTGWLYFVNKVFSDNKHLYIIASILIFVCCAFPWNFLVYGRISPNLLSFCLLPGCMAVFIDCFKKGNDINEIRTGLIFVCLTGYVAIFTQPNLIFSMIVLLCSYCVETIVRSGYKFQFLGCKKLSCRKTAILFLVFLMFVWILFYISPFTVETRRFNWPSKTPPLDAILNALTLTHASSITFQGFVVATLAILGIVYMVRTKKNYWLICSYFITFVIYVWCSLIEGRIKHLIGGFWYTDQYRLIGLLTIASIPLIVCGGFLIYEFIMSRFKKPTKFKQSYCAAIYTLCFAFILLIPNISLPDGSIIKTTVGNIQTKVYDYLAISDSSNVDFLDNQKMKFLDEAKKITGDQIVENSPLDGSLLAFQYNGMKTVHRHIFPGTEAGNADFVLDNELMLAQQIDRLSVDESIYRLAKKDNIKYVLQLASDESSYPDIPWTDTKYNYNISRYFYGIRNINDETPGFKLVLQSGEMKLYEIQY